MTPRIDVASDSSFHVDANCLRYFLFFPECIIYVVEMRVDDDSISKLHGGS